MQHLVFLRKPRQKAQGLLEFALALPILLLLVFGIIEFGRLLQAWLALENGARFGVRYAITGEYNPNYCDEAAAVIAPSFSLTTAQLIAQDQVERKNGCPARLGTHAFHSRYGYGRRHGHCLELRLLRRLCRLPFQPQRNLRRYLPR